MQTFQLPMPPALSSLTGNSDSGGRRKTLLYSEWRKTAGWTLRAQRPKLIADPVRLTIHLQRPAYATGKPRKSDLDNRLKALWDLMTGIVLLDDSQIWHCEFRWSSKPGAVVTVDIIPPDERSDYDPPGSSQEVA